MRILSFVGSRGVSAEMIADKSVAEVTFHPSGEADHYRLGDGFAAELHRTVSAHFSGHKASLLMISYVGDLAPIAMSDLSAFAVPILPSS